MWYLRVRGRGERGKSTSQVNDCEIYMRHQTRHLRVQELRRCFSESATSRVAKRVDIISRKVIVVNKHPEEPHT